MESVTATLKWASENFRGDMARVPFVMPSPGAMATLLCCRRPRLPTGSVTAGYRRLQRNLASYDRRMSDWTAGAVMYATHAGRHPGCGVAAAGHAGSDDEVLACE